MVIAYRNKKEVIGSQKWFIFFGDQFNHLMTNYNSVNFDLKQLFENLTPSTNMHQKLAYILARDENFGFEKASLLDELTLDIKNNTSNSKQANEIWNQLKEDHYFWCRSPAVLNLCQIDQTKVFMLVLLEDAVKQKWLALPQQQKQSLKDFIVNIILAYSSQQNLSKSMHNILSKCNSILVQIVKYEWNTTWRSFINDICDSSTKNVNICENNFYILKMLSQEIFDYSKNQMTQFQIQQLKLQMNQDFTTIFQLCKLVLQNMYQAKQSLIRACLETLNAFLSWIPMYYIVCTDLIDKLVLMFPSDYLRNHALSCLVEIASLQIDRRNQDQKMKYMFMLKRVTEELNLLIPLTNNDQQVQRQLNLVKKKNRNIFQILARGIANFYSQFFKNQYQWLEESVMNNEQGLRVCHLGFRYILMMMKIDQDQVFKITIDFFHFYLGVYLQRQPRRQANFGGLSYGLKLSVLQPIYQQIFRQVMKIVCLKMAKPEQVLIVIDQDGIPVREQLQNTQNTSLYEVQKQLAQYLVRYNWQDMKKFIIGEVEKQQLNDTFNFDTLNSLSWIIGSLCGSIQQKQQKAFFISTLRVLLQLCEIRKGKQNKAVIASCIMYVVGQYPSFLRHNWTFLKTVVKKLFQFMKEQFPGIMQMACNAFLKICKSTGDQFTIIQHNQSEPFVRQLLRRIPDVTKKFISDTLQFIFYESLGHIIATEPEACLQLEFIKQALGNLLYQNLNIVQMAKNNTNFLKEEDIVRKIIYYLKINQHIAIGTGRAYTVFLQNIAQTINNFYLYYSVEVNATIRTNGPQVLNFMTVRNMRLVKKQVIKIYTRMLQKCNDLNFQYASYILNTFIYPLGQLLNDFQQCPPETKQQQFVSLFTVVLQKLNLVLSHDFLTKLIQMIFTSSLPLITSDFNSFPQIRSNFFSFIKSLVKYNFAPLFSLDQQYFNTILDCIIWSFRHELSTYSDLGLELVQQVLLNVNKNNEIANVFYCRYHMKILTDILDVMTDGFHKSGIQSQTKILFILIHVTTQNIVYDPIDSNKNSNQSNSEFLYHFLIERLSGSFRNVSKAVTMEKVTNWFQQTDEKLFKLEVADYLVLINRFCPDDLTEK